MWNVFAGEANNKNKCLLCVFCSLCSLRVTVPWQVCSLLPHTKEINSKAIKGSWTAAPLAHKDKCEWKRRSFCSSQTGPSVCLDVRLAGKGPPDVYKGRVLSGEGSDPAHSVQLQPTLPLRILVWIHSLRKMVDLRFTKDPDACRSCKCTGWTPSWLMRDWLGKIPRVGVSCRNGVHVKFEAFRESCDSWEKGLKWRKTNQQQQQSPATTPNRFDQNSPCIVVQDVWWEFSGGSA